MDPSNLIINYVPPTMAQEEFKALFEPYGTVESCRLMIDMKTNRSLGYGFVKYSNEMEAQAAINALNGHQLQNKRLKVAVSRPPTEDIKNCKLYIQNFPATYDQAAVEQMLRQYGTIIESRLLVDHATGMSKCTAFVQMGTRQEAQAAIDALNQTQMPGCTRPLYMKFAVDKAAKKRTQEFGQQQLYAAAGMAMLPGPPGGYGRAPPGGGGGGGLGGGGGGGGRGGPYGGAQHRFEPYGALSGPAAAAGMAAYQHAAQAAQAQAHYQMAAAFGQGPPGGPTMYGYPAAAAAPGGGGSGAGQGLGGGGGGGGMANLQSAAGAAGGSQQQQPQQQVYNPQLAQHSAYSQHQG